MNKCLVNFGYWSYIGVADHNDGLFMRIKYCKIWRYSLVLIFAMLPWNIHPVGGTSPVVRIHSFWMKIRKAKTKAENPNRRHQVMLSKGMVKASYVVICCGFWPCTSKLYKNCHGRYSTNWYLYGTIVACPMPISLCFVWTCCGEIILNHLIDNISSVFHNFLDTEITKCKIADLRNVTSGMHLNTYRSHHSPEDSIIWGIPIACSLRWVKDKEIMVSFSI